LCQKKKEEEEEEARNLAEDREKYEEIRGFSTTCQIVISTPGTPQGVSPGFSNTV